jgi:signal transduction histidine kinase
MIGPRALLLVAGILALAPVPAMHLAGRRAIDSLLATDRAQREAAAISRFSEELAWRLREVDPESGELRLAAPESMRVAHGDDCGALDPALGVARSLLATSDDASAFRALEVLDPVLGGNSPDARFLAMRLAADALAILARSDLASRMRQRAVAADTWSEAPLSPAFDRVRILAALDDGVATTAGLRSWLGEIEGRPTDLCELAAVAVLCAGDTERERLRRVARREREAIELRAALEELPARETACVVLGSDRAYAVATERDVARRVAIDDLSGGRGLDPGVESMTVPRRFDTPALAADLGDSEIAIALPPSAIFGGRHPRRLLDLALAIYAALVVVLLVALRRGQRRAEELAGTRADLIAQITHELRTPLAVLRTYGDSLAKGRVAPEARDDYAATMSREAARLGAIVDRVARVARGEDEERDESVATDAAEVLRQLAATYGDETAAAGGVFVAKLPQHAIVVAIGEDDLRLIVDVLLDNALHYGRTAAAPPRIEFQATVKEDNLEIVVADEGPGIPQVERSRLFERFARGSSGTRSQHRGAGMGLYVARRLARAGGGDVALEFGERGGTRAVARLPMEDEES